MKFFFSVLFILLMLFVVYNIKVDWLHTASKYAHLKTVKNKD